ncbi:flagellar hook-associated protein FlgK [Thioclava sp. GXIMD2076]|uniref:flagellar hook-associated protein FlgK n=1 Tax=Thioclava sp. GXIMD2076 TaxID=3131931 RepID=UPI0030D2A96E
MSLSAAFTNALSGLTVSSKMAQVVSSNVANAMTEGYGRRTVETSAVSSGGVGYGVKIDGISRQVNESLLQDRRLADAAAGEASVTADFYASVEDMIGDPTDANSLSAKMASFESALVEAASSPDSTGRLTTVVNTAKAVAEQLNSMSDEINDIRLSADKQIANQVDLLNTTLNQVDDLNDEILKATTNGRDATALMDERQALIDQISEIVPLEIKERDNGQVAIYTSNGATLLDGKVYEVGFTETGRMAANFSLEGGTLSGLTVNGKEINTTEDGALGGGTLSALFAVRDELAPAAQEQLDTVARDLIERLSSSDVDTTITTGSAGFFTDSGSAFDTADELGIAGRIEVNAAIDPSEGGEVWRVRDGIYATTAGDVGDSTILNNIADALSTTRAASSSAFGGSSYSASGLMSELLSNYSTARQSAELTESYTTAKQEALVEEELSNGVDTDQELQSLLVIEQSYAANAKVMQTLDSLMQELLDL